MENKTQEMNKYSKSCIENLSNIIYATAICKACLDNVQKPNAKQEAVNSYLSSVSDYLITDDKGNFNGMDISKFCQKAVEVGLMVFDKTNRRYKIVDGKTMQDFVEKLNLSLPFLQVMFGEMQEFGAEFDQREVKDMNEYGKKCESMKKPIKQKERVHLGRLVLQCAKDDGLTVPDWDFILKGISIIDEVTLKGLVSDASAVIRAVSEKLKEHDVLCGRMTVEVTV